MSLHCSWFMMLLEFTEEERHRIFVDSCSVLLIFMCILGILVNFTEKKRSIVTMCLL